jgi:hypothetical protein
MSRILRIVEPLIVLAIGIAVVLVVSLSATRSKADVAQDWNNIALDLQARGNSPSNQQLFGNAVNSNPGTRASAIQWIAVNDATVPLTGANNPYYAQLAAPSLPGGFQDLAVQAAVAQASHDAIVGTLASLGFNGAQQAAWTSQLDADLTNSINGLVASPNAAQSAAISAGQSLGSQAASQIVALRATDGWNAPQSHTFPANPQPGDWILPVNTALTTANTPQWGNVKPFSLISPSQFRAPAPPSLTSAQYETAFKTTQAYGYHLDPSGSTVLSTGQAANPVNTGFDPVAANPSLHLLSPSDVTNTQKVAAFWRQNPSNPINEVAGEVATTKGLSLAEKITLFEKLNVTLADARIAEWDTKYTYNFWRPYTAITLTENGTPVPGLTTGNPNLAADPNWQPYLATPNHPSYGSGHTATGAGFQFLADYFGANPGTFTVHSYSLDGTPYGGTTFTFDNFADPRLANADSRIYGGIHWTFDNQTADVLGESVADYVFSNPLVVPEPAAIQLAIIASLAMLIPLRRRMQLRQGQIAVSQTG